LVGPGFVSLLNFYEETHLFVRSFVRLFMSYMEFDTYYSAAIKVLKITLNSKTASYVDLHTESNRVCVGI